MRALTLIQPMAAAIVHGSKRIENRPADLPRAMRGVRTVVAVHAGKKWDDRYERVVEMIDGRPGGVHERRTLWYAGRLRDEGVVGLMLLSGRRFTTRFDAVEGCREPRAYHWFAGPFGYEILHAVALDVPIPCRGMQGFWPVPREVEEDVSFQLALGQLLVIGAEPDKVDPR